MLGHLYEHDKNIGKWAFEKVPPLFIAPPLIDTRLIDTRLIEPRLINTRLIDTRLIDKIIDRTSID
jgi:hypothetical protein